MQKFQPADCNEQNIWSEILFWIENQKEMQIVLSGFNGLIGSSLRAELTSEGHEIKLITRAGLYDTPAQLAQVLKNADAVIHLAGAPILRRWTRKNRNDMYNSRVITTRNLVQAIHALPSDSRPGIYITASAIGIYESGEVHTEASENYAGHFAGLLTKEWESASEGLPEGVRRIVFRIGLVLDRNAVLISRLRLPFLLFAGGPVGSGRQPFPFIHLKDVTGAIKWALNTGNASGIYNLTAPDQIDNRHFSSEFGRQLGRPSWIPVPKLPLQILYGKAAQLIFESPAVIPERLQKEGYPFRFPKIGDALKDVLH